MFIVASSYCWLVLGVLLGGAAQVGMAGVVIVGIVATILFVVISMADVVVYDVCPPSWFDGWCGLVAEGGATCARFATILCVLFVPPGAVALHVVQPSLCIFTLLQFCSFISMLCLLSSSIIYIVVDLLSRCRRVKLRAGITVN